MRPHLRASEATLTPWAGFVCGLYRRSKFRWADLGRGFYSRSKFGWGNMRRARLEGAELGWATAPTAHYLDRRNLIGRWRGTRGDVSLWMAAATQRSWLTPLGLCPAPPRRRRRSPELLCFQPSMSSLRTRS